MGRRDSYYVEYGVRKDRIPRDFGVRSIYHNPEPPWDDAWQDHIVEDQLTLEFMSLMEDQ